METICKTGEMIGGRRTLLSETNVSMFVKVAGGSKSMKIIHENECNSSSSSSIGEDSDGDLEDDDVAESSYNYDRHNNYNDNDHNYNYNYHNDNKSNNDNGSFDDAIKALEQALPIRRGISTFYNGKSKSFTSLNDVCPTPTSSIQDIAKPENAYTRKRRNLSAFNLSSIKTGGISKKPKTTMLHFTLERNNPTFNKQATQSQINRSMTSRSFSMVNLLRCNPTKIGNC